VAGTVLSALAVGYYAKEQHYSLSTSPHMVAAYIAFTLALSCFTLAIVGWGPWLGWQRFPHITVLVSEERYSVAALEMPGSLPPTRTTLMILKVTFVNGDADRNVIIRAAYLRVKTKPDSPWGYWQIFTEPKRAANYDNPVQALEFPVNLGPRASVGGYLVFEIPNHFRDQLAPPPGYKSYVEIIEALSGRRAVFPAGPLGFFETRRWLVPTTLAERVTGPPVVYSRGSPWEGMRRCERCAKRPGQYEGSSPVEQALLCKRCRKAIKWEAINASRR
jgi:hypothetical protein